MKKKGKEMMMDEKEMKGDDMKRKKWRRGRCEKRKK
jgi:hypothetical protein